MARRGSLMAWVQRDDSRERPCLLVASGWDIQLETNRWDSVWPRGRVAHPEDFFHARLLVSDGALPRALFACVGPPSSLARLTAQIASDNLGWTQTWQALPALRADPSTLAVQLRASWPDERASGDTGDVVRLLARMAGFLDDDGEGGPT